MKNKLFQVEPLWWLTQNYPNNQINHSTVRTKEIQRKLVKSTVDITDKPNSQYNIVSSQVNSNSGVNFNFASYNYRTKTCKRLIRPQEYKGTTSLTHLREFSYIFQDHRTSLRYFSNSINNGLVRFACICIEKLPN